MVWYEVDAGHRDLDGLGREGCPGNHRCGDVDLQPQEEQGRVLLPVRGAATGHASAWFQVLN